MFILYVNDFSEEAGKSANILQFVDDLSNLSH